METIEDRIAYIGNMMGCKDRMVNGQVSLKCAGCRCYDADVPKCDIRDEAIQAMNEDAWADEHAHLDPHPQSEDD